MPSRSPAGQASGEYVAILLVVATVLAGAATLAVAVPGVGERVVGAVRTGLCIVGGDICRSSDARAAGLDPCVTRANAKWQDTTVEVAVIRLGGHGEWELALRSDGSALVTRLEEVEAGATVGIGLTFSPANVGAGASANVTAGYRGGSAWRFADARSAAAFLERAERDAAFRDTRPPDARWHAATGALGGEVAIAVADLVSAGLTTDAAGAAGLRTEGARKTLTLDLDVGAPHLAADLPGFPAGPGRRSTVVVDVTWEGGALRELALRSAVAEGDRLEEFTARLDLREPESRALAAQLLRPGQDARVTAQALVRHAARHGVVQRDGYVLSERRRGLAVAARLGVALGLSHQRITAERRLVDAVARVRGGPPQRRMDCVGM